MNPVYAISHTYSEIWNKIQTYISHRIPVMLLGNSGSGKEILIREILEEMNLKSKVVEGDPSRKPEDFILEWERASSGEVIVITDLSLLSQEIQMFLNKALIHLAKSIHPPAIVSTSRLEIRDMIRKRDFREDLFFRLGVVIFEIPPLFERKNEILPLSHYFLKLYAKKYNKRLKYFDEKLIHFLLKFHFPGDLKQLESLIECLVIAGRGRTLKYENLPESFYRDSRLKSEGILPIVPGISLSEYEKEIIRENLRMNNGNRQKTARVLGISIRTLYRKLDEYDLKEANFNFP